MDLKTICLDKVVKGECIQSTKGDSDLSLGPSLHCKSEEEDLRRERSLKLKRKRFEDTTRFNDVEEMIQRWFSVAVGFDKVKTVFSFKKLPWQSG